MKTFLYLSDLQWNALGVIATFLVSCIALFLPTIQNYKKNKRIKFLVENEFFDNINDIKIAINDSMSKHKEVYYVSILEKISTSNWNKLKERLSSEGSQTVTNCHQLKMLAQDGKMRTTDVANVETLLRLIQSVPSKKAEPIKLWLAKVGYERMQEISDPEKSINRRINHIILRHSRILIDSLLAIKICGIQGINITSPWIPHIFSLNKFSRKILG